MIRLFKHHIDISRIFLAGFELWLLYELAVGIGYFLNTLGYGISPQVETLAAVFVTLTTGIGMTSVGLYSRVHFFHFDDVFSRALVIFPLVIAALLVIVGLYDHFIAEAPRRANYFLCIIVLTQFFPIFLALRFGLHHVIDRTGLFKRRVLVIGSGERAAKIHRLCLLRHDRSVHVVGYVRLGSPPDAPAGPEANRRQGDRRPDYWIVPEQLMDFCAEQKVDEIVVASEERRGLPIQALLACKLRGIKVTEYSSFWERESGQIDLDGITPSWLVFSDGFQTGALRAVVKRAFDSIVSLTLLLLTLPVTLAAAALIKLESQGPLFYQQERVGLNGRPFMVLKFRSMRTDAEKDGPRWAAKNDSRVTRVGAFIRKVRIDEIPQVVNVLRGDMAFVGPRPERPVFVDELAEKIPYYTERHSVKPGITGWAQINYPYGSGIDDAKMKLSYDLYYIKNGSLFLDIIIMVQTVKVLLWNAGAR